MTVETKAHQGTNDIGDGDVRSAMDEFLGVFENFKDANDERLAELEKRGNEDVVLSEKVDRINDALTEHKAALDHISLKGQRPGRATSVPIVPDERKSAFLRYMRAGDATAIHSLEAKSLSTTTDAEGGYLAPLDTERLINTTVRDISPIRQIASVREIGANVFRKPVSIGAGAAGWVGETDVRPQTATPNLSAIDFPTMELYAMPAASQTLLDDGVVDVEQWLADEVNAEFAAQEGAAFVNGDGVNQPNGFLSYPIVDNAGQAHGEIGAINTGIDGGFDSTDPADGLFDLIYAPPANLSR